MAAPAPVGTDDGRFQPSSAVFDSFPHEITDSSGFGKSASPAYVALFDEQQLPRSSTSLPPPFEIVPLDFEDRLVKEVLSHPQLAVVGYEEIRRWIDTYSASLLRRVASTAGGDQHSHRARESVQVFIGQLPSFVTQDTLAMCFEFIFQYPGVVVSATVPKDRPGSHAAYGLLTLQSKEFVPEFIKLHRRTYIGARNLFFAPRAEDMELFQNIVHRALDEDAGLPSHLQTAIPYAKSCAVVNKANPPPTKRKPPPPPPFGHPAQFQPPPPPTYFVPFADQPRLVYQQPGPTHAILSQQGQLQVFALSGGGASSSPYFLQAQPFPVTGPQHGPAAALVGGGNYVIIANASPMATGLSHQQQQAATHDSSSPKPGNMSSSQSCASTPIQGAQQASPPCLTQQQMPLSSLAQSSRPPAWLSLTHYHDTHPAPN